MRRLVVLVTVLSLTQVRYIGRIDYTILTRELNDDKLLLGKVQSPLIHQIILKFKGRILCNI